MIQLVECLHRCNVGMISDMDVSLFVNLAFVTNSNILYTPKN